MFTTLRALKWAHDLGIRQERVRIASHLQLKGQQARISNDTMLEMLKENADRKKPNKQEGSRLEFAIAVNDRVQEIIQEMFEDQGGQWLSGASVMFPDDDHKGKVK